ncbi:unnamed protein product [Cochlearia groenlandica]
MEKESKEQSFFLLGNYCKKANPSTPPPTWRLELSTPRNRASSAAKEFLTNPEVSVRKLCADLYETEQFRQRIGQRRFQRRDSDVESPCNSPLHNHQPQNRGSLRRQISTTNDHRLVHRNADLLQPNSLSSSRSSLLEVMARKPACSQTGSSLVKSTSYGLDSSTKLVKVLNRIWSLEEQNTTNMSLVKALKMELNECRAEIKEVRHRDKHSDKRISNKKNQEEEEIKNVFRSVKKELDDERKVRKKSESMHRKLTRELCEAKHCLTKALKDLEKEKKKRITMENLCNQRLQMNQEEDHFNVVDMEKRRSLHTSKGMDDDDLASMYHQRVCLKEVEKRTRRDNKLKLMKKKKTEQVYNLSMSSQGDKIHPEISPRDIDDHKSLRKSITLSRNVNSREDKHCSLKDKLMEARVESRRLRSLKPESSPSHMV